VIVEQIRRIVEASIVRARNHRVHYESASGEASLCNLVSVFSAVDGEKIRVWHPTKAPVTCTSCVNVVKARVRRQLTGLSGEQYEDLLAHIATFREKYAGPATTKTS
jgi:hypothetical protein